MNVNDLYSLIEDIEQEQKCLFIIYDDELPAVGIDILEWENEDCIDGGWFDSVEAAYKYCLEYQTEPKLRPLVAVEVWSDQGGTFYYEPKLIYDYQTAVEYHLNVYNTESDHYCEFYLFDKNIDLNDIINDVESHDYFYHEYEDFYNIEEVQKYFSVQHATYPDGTIAVLGDEVTVDSDDFSWGLFQKQDIIGVVTLLDSPYYIQLKLKNFSRELRLAHYLVKKHG